MPPAEPGRRAPPDARREPAEPTELVRALHAAPQQAVLELAGGTQALAWLHAVGGSSRTVLEATDRYSAASLAALLGAAPAKAVSRGVAAAMAAAARRRALALAAPGTPVVGAACTAALASDRPRRGAHRAVVAVADALGSVISDLELAKGERTRRQEEAAVSRLLLAELAAACGAGPPPGRAAAALEGDVAKREFRPSEAFAALASGGADWLLLDTGGHLAEGPPRWDEAALLPGSYHPLHAGHLALAEAAARMLRRQVVFELTLVNADKAPLDLAEAQRRAAQFAGRAPLVLSRLPLFAAKAARFPGAVFIVGMDTAARLLDARFYGGSRASMEQALAAIARCGASFLVAGRRVGGRYRTLADLDLALPAGLRRLFRELPERSFRCDLSSSEIRARGARHTAPR